MADIAEQICLAVDQIVSERLKSIKYDSTIIATIVDNSEAKNYKYICSNGSAQFVAFGKDTSFKINDSVQVTIPNNDYSQQKVIIGKYVAEEATPYVFVQPFNTIIDITTNLIKNPSKEPIQGSLLANEDYEDGYNEETNYYNSFNKEKILWSKFFEESHANFNRLGIQGQFRSQVSSLKPVVGNYGYRLEILSSTDEIITNEGPIANWGYAYSDLLNKQNYDINATLNETPESWYIKVKDVLSLNAIEGSFKTAFINAFTTEYGKNPYSEECKRLIYSMLYANAKVTEIYLDSSEMCGNPYNFQSFFEQEKVFDISSLKSIFGMSLFFYEKSATFKNKDGKQIRYTTPTGLDLPPNLFTKDPYICLGYDISEFDKEQAFLYSLNTSTYITKDGIVSEKNRKTVRLRWLHEFENEQIKVITEDSEIQPYDEITNPTGYEVRWYRYKLGAPSADEYSGVYWQRVEADEISPFSYTFLPGVNAPSEQIKAIVLYDSKVVESNIITFTSEIEVVNSATAALLAGLSIWCDDEDLSGLASENDIAISAKTVKNGIYHIYGQNNNLLDETKANIVLTLEAHFADVQVLSSTYDVDAESPLLKEATEIIWEMPLNNTMIVIDGFNYNYEYDKNTEVTDKKVDFAKIEANDPTGERFKLPGYFTDASIRIRGNTVQITRKCKSLTDFTINPFQDYRVRKTYSSTYLQNTVKCTIRKDSIIYSATKELIFGIMGTNGTDATVVIDFNNNKTALTATLDTDKDGKLIGESLKVTARLYDQTHNEWDFNNSDLGISCKWEWAYYYEGHINPDAESNLPVDQITSKMDAYKAANKEATDKDLLTYLNSIAKVQLITQELDSSISAPNICHLNHSDHLHIAMTTEGQDVFFLVLKVTISGYGDYDLVSYKAIPIRKNKTFRNYIGPTEIIYSTSGYANYYKQPLQLWSCNPEDVNEFDFVSDYTKISLYNSNWNVYNPYGEKATYVGEVNNEDILKPVTIYVKSAMPYGIICYSNSLNTNDPVWIQPLVILQNEYPSATVNRWDGKSIQLGTDDDPSTILTPSLAAGSKDSEGRFSGVMIGDWKGTDAEFGLTEQTGVYGFHQGKISYAFKEDGTGFIGKSGHGRIIFKGDSGVIKSESWRDGENETGMYLDLDDGILKLQKEPGFDQVFLTAKEYRPNYYYTLTIFPFAVPVGLGYGVDFEATGKTIQVTPETQYYKEGMAIVSNMSAASFAARVQAGTLYSKNATDYEQCTSSSVYNERTVYYAYVYTEAYTDNIVNWSTEYSNYYIKDAEGKYVTATSTKDDNTTYYTKTLIYVEAIIDDSVNWESDYKNYYTKNDKGEYIPATATKEETTYYTQAASFTPITILDWSKNYSSFYTKATDGSYKPATSTKQKDTVYYTKALSKTATSKTDFEADKTKYWIRKADTYTQIKITPAEGKTLEDYYDSSVAYYEHGFEALNYGTIDNLTPRPSYWNTTEDPLIKEGKFYYVLEEKYTQCTDLVFDTTKTYFEDNTGLTARYITLSAAASRFPLAIGNHSNEASRKFRVDWDGTCYIQDGIFSGDIDAETGYLGDLILRGGLTLNATGYIAANKDSLTDFITDGFWLDREGLNIGNSMNYFFATTQFTGFYNGNGGTKVTGSGIDLYAQLSPQTAAQDMASKEGLIHMGWVTGEYSYPFIRFGSGTQASTNSDGTMNDKFQDDAGIIKKFGGGMWFGAHGNNTTGTSPQADSAAKVGVFCNSNENTVYRCEVINGTRVFEKARYARFAP